MGQLGTKIQALACVYNFNNDGPMTTGTLMGLNIGGGQSIMTIRYTVISPIVLALGVATNLDAGWQAVGFTGMMNVADTIANLNLGIGSWFTHIPTAPGYPKTVIGSTSPWGVGIMVAGGGDTVIGGSILFNFIIQQNSI